MIVAFGPDSASYYINNGVRSTWANIPGDLVNLLNNDPRFSTSNVISLSLFPNNGYFLVAQSVCATKNVPTTIKDRINATSGNKNVLWIDFDGRDFDTYVICLRDGTFLHNALPNDLLEAILHHVTCGIGFFCLGGSGTWAFDTISPVHQCISSKTFIEIRRHLDGTKLVKDVILNRYNHYHAYIIYQDGTCWYRVPDEWGTESLASVRPCDPYGQHPNPHEALSVARFRLTVAFGPSMNTFYVGNGRQAQWSADLPARLNDLLLHDSRCSPDRITSLALFRDGGYLLATQDFCASANIPRGVKSCIDAAGGVTNVLAIDFDGQSAEPDWPCIILTKSGRLYHQGLPRNLLENIFTDMWRGVRWLSLGAQGVWAYETADTGILCLSPGRPAEVYEKLTAPGPIQTTFLSSYNKSSIVIVEEDGGLRWYAPGPLIGALGNIRPSPIKAGVVEYPVGGSNQSSTHSPPSTQNYAPYSPPTPSYYPAQHPPPYQAQYPLYNQPQPQPTQYPNPPTVIFVNTPSSSNASDYVDAGINAAGIGLAATQLALAGGCIIC